MSVLTVTRGTTKEYTITVRYQGGAYGLSGASLAFEVRRNAADSAALFSKTTAGSSIVVTSVSGGIATFAIDPEDIAAFSVTEIYDWRLHMVGTDGKTRRIATGTLEVKD